MGTKWKNIASKTVMQITRLGMYWTSNEQVIPFFLLLEPPCMKKTILDSSIWEISDWPI